MEDWKSANNRRLFITKSFLTTAEFYSASCESMWYFLFFINLNPKAKIEVYQKKLLRIRSTFLPFYSYSHLTLNPLDRHIFFFDKKGCESWEQKIYQQKKGCEGGNATWKLLQRLNDEVKITSFTKGFSCYLCAFTSLS